MRETHGQILKRSTFAEDHCLLPRRAPKLARATDFARFVAILFFCSTQKYAAMRRVCNSNPNADGACAQNPVDIPTTL
jgi:hypothetical protein